MTTDPGEMAGTELGEDIGASARSRPRKASLRQRRILDTVMAQGSCTAQELAQSFGVSLMTIHRDLDELERRGVVRKFHGGVTALPSSVFESQMSFRRSAHNPEKERLARAALRHVDPGSAVLLDDSSTVLHMVPGLAGLAPLHVATASLAALTELREHTELGLNVIGLGGDYDATYASFTGSACVEQVQGLRVDAFFMSTSAVSGAEAFHQDERIVAVKRAMMRVAQQRFLLLDASKFGRVALHRVASLHEYTLVLCDSSTPREHLRGLEAAGIPYELA